MIGPDRPAPCMQRNSKLIRLEARAIFFAGRRWSRHPAAQWLRWAEQSWEDHPWAENRWEEFRFDNRWEEFRWDEERWEDMKWAALVYISFAGPALATLGWHAPHKGWQPKRALDHALLVRAMIQTKKFGTCFAAGWGCRPSFAQQLLWFLFLWTVGRPDAVDTASVLYVAHMALLACLDWLAASHLVWSLLISSRLISALLILSEFV